MALKDTLRPFVPSYLLRIRKWCIDAKPLVSLFRYLPPRDAAKMTVAFTRAHQNVRCAHSPQEISEIACGILSRQDVPGCIIEAGSFKGGATAKLSLLARYLNRELYVFDSFAGIPDNQEAHTTNIWGYDAKFAAGDWAGGLEEVKANVARYGAIARCRFVPGLFSDTMPGFHEPTMAAFIDVDLAESTETCLQYLWPLLSPRGVIFSHDGHLPLCIEVFRRFASRTGVRIPGLGDRKLLAIQKA